MDQQIKKMIVDALMKVVDNAPTRTINSSFGYSSKPYEVTESQFIVWLNYVNSVLRIASQHIGTSLYLSIQNDIYNLADQPHKSYREMTFEICDKILDFAQTIIYL